MKNFFSRYSYTMVRLYLNQFAISLFGVALSFACDQAHNATLLRLTSVFAILFYLFLQYAVMWEVGAKDGIAAAAHHTPRGLWRGLAIGAAANALNFLLALLMLPGAFSREGTFAFRLGAGAEFLALMTQGMFQGILAAPFRGLQLHDFAWVFLVIPLPAILVCTGAYLTGSYNLHLTNILIPKNTDVKNNGRPK